MLLGALNLKKEFAPIFEKFKCVYVHNEGDRGGKSFVESACKIIPYDKLYIISARKVDNECKDPSDLQIKGILNFDSLIATAEHIDKAYYDTVNQNTEQDNSNIEKMLNYETERHVEIAEEIMNRLYICYYNEDFYVYGNRSI